MILVNHGIPSLKCGTIFSDYWNVILFACWRWECYKLYWRLLKDFEYLPNTKFKCWLKLTLFTIMIIWEVIWFLSFSCRFSRSPPTYPCSLLHTPAHADAQRSTKKWQKLVINKFFRLMANSSTNRSPKDTSCLLAAKLIVKWKRLQFFGCTESCVFTTIWQQYLLQIDDWRWGVSSVSLNQPFSLRVK